MNRGRIKRAMKTDVMCAIHSHSLLNESTRETEKKRHSHKKLSAEGETPVRSLLTRVKRVIDYDECS